MFNGPPPHVLLVLFVFVLGPPTAALAIVCTFWPAARQRLVWLVLALAVIRVVLTPLTIDAGEWLAKRKGRSPLLHAHTELGDTMAYFSIALVAAAALIAFVHLREARGKSVKPIARWLIAAVVVIVSVATTVQGYRIGDSRAKASWSKQSAVGSSTP